MKKTILFLIVIMISLLFFSFKISENNGNTTISFKEVPKNYKVSYYDYGVNIVLKNFSSKKLLIEKTKNSVVRVLPLSNKRTLIKIQTKIRNLKDHIIFNKTGSGFVIKITKKVVKNNTQKKLDSNTLPKDEFDKKSVLDLAKEYSLIKANSKPQQQRTEKKAETVHKVLKKDNLKNKETKTTTKKEIAFNETEITDTDKYDFSKNVFKTYSVLAVLCLFMVFIAVIFKKYKNKLKLSNSSKLIKVIYSEEIIPKKSIVIVKIMNEHYILGVTESNISIVDKIDSDSLDEELKVIENEQEKNKFIKYLKKEEEKDSRKTDSDEKEKLIKMIQGKLKTYQKVYNNNE